jgi:hypothetical protein
MDRHAHGLRGAVRRVFTERLWYNNAVSAQGEEFDRDGKLTGSWSQPPNGPRADLQYDAAGHLSELHVSVAENADGSRARKEELPIRDLAWTMEGLHGVYLRTSGAKYAETMFEASGAPVRTVFRGEQGEEMSQLLYLCDGNGNILEARESGGTSFWLRAGQFSATFEYDGGGRVIASATHLRTLVGQQQLHRTLYRYNDHDDVVWAKEDNNPAPATEYEYEYDEQGNWTRQVMHHALGVDEVHRRIEYWSE